MKPLRVRGNWNRGSVSHVALVLGLSAIALLVRVVLACRGGLWRDEALFLFVTRAESWVGMVEFLRHHESHPPLFYFVMRPWLAMVGPSDAAALALPVIIGVAMVPVIYLVAASLFSRRVGIVAGLLVALSPALAENSALVRPYSLLPLLTLLSVYTLIRSLDRASYRAWIAYVASNLALLYTHNWAFLVLAGEWIAVALMVATHSERRTRRIVLGFAIAQCLILIGYLPWLPALLYQTQHAGNRAISSDGHVNILPILFVGFRRLLQASVLAYPVGESGEPWTDVQRWLTVLPLIVLGLAGFRRLRPTRASPIPVDSEPPIDNQASERLALFLLIATPSAAFAAALALASTSNVLMSRSLAMLDPLVILAVAYWLARSRLRPFASIASIGIVLLLASYAATLYALSRVSRSNAKEIAAAVAARTQPSDLVIIAPEWLASSFNRYYTPSVQQIDFPHFGREGMVDMAGVRERLADPLAIERLRPVIASARRDGRRVWLLMEAGDVRKISADDIGRASRPQGLNDAAMIRANQIRQELRALFGEPDSSVVGPPRLTQFERFRAYLFAAPTQT